jgi:hypothetical protein
VVLILLATPSVNSAQAMSASSTITVSGYVPPHVWLIVDDKGVIKQIFSNSSEESEPAAMLSLSGPVVPMTENIQAQYAKIKPSLTYKYGYIYQKPSPKPRVVQSSSISKLIYSHIEFAASRLSVL